MTKIDLNNLDIRICNSNDVKDIYNIQEIVINNFKDEEKGYFLPFTEEWYLRIVNNPDKDGEIYGAFYENKMIAWIFLSVSTRMEQIKSFIPDINGKCADIDGVIVLPEYRGNGLQKILVNYLEKKAKEKGIDNVVAEVTFENDYSLKNLEDLGYEIKTWYKKVENIKRHILLKKLNTTFIDKNNILKVVDNLILMYKRGELGGEVMPEDANPHFEKSSLENYLYFTLPMALNYQRNSYTLWESALKTYNDEETKFVFNPKVCLEKTFEEVQYALTKYKVALQKQKQTEIWLSLCNTFVELFDGDIRKLFNNLDNDVDKIRNYIQKENKKKFPYLSGTKICNYWMYVIYQYTDRKYTNIENLTVAPDTHVCKATHKLGLINDEEFNSSNVQQIVIDRWQELFRNTKYKPIDIHTPLWLWSRNGFKEVK